MFQNPYGISNIHDGTKKAVLYVVVVGNLSVEKLNEKN